MIKLIDSADNPFDDWSKLLNQLHLPSSEPIQSAHRLAYLNLIRKAGTYKKLSTTTTEFIPKGYIVKEWAGLLHHIFHNLQYDLIYEYCAILVRRNSSLPVNLLIEAIECCPHHPQLAAYIVPVLGETGYFICNKNKEWHWLHPDYWNDACSFKASLQRMFAFEMYVKQNTGEAILYFFKNITSWTEKELGLSCSIILKNIQHEHEPLIMNALNGLNTTSGLHLLRLVFQFPDHEITQKFKSEFDQKFHTTKIETIEVPAIKKSKKPLEFKKILGTIPPSWYNTSTRKIEVYNQLIKFGWITEFIDCLSRYQDELSALDFAKFLIDQKLFTELIPVEKISELLNYETFNQLALYWIKSNKGDIDLEAFLKFIRVEKHFWSDDLLLGILSFSEYKRLVKEYNLEVFFEKIPYKINPNSKQLGKIHKQIQFSEDPHFDFNQIIKFRQDLRK